MIILRRQKLRQVIVKIVTSKRTPSLQLCLESVLRLALCSYLVQVNTSWLPGPGKQSIYMKGKLSGWTRCLIVSSSPQYLSISYHTEKYGFAAVICCMLFPAAWLLQMQQLPSSKSVGACNFLASPTPNVSHVAYWCWKANQIAVDASSEYQGDEVNQQSQVLCCTLMGSPVLLQKTTSEEPLLISLFCG